MFNLDFDIDLPRSGMLAAIAILLALVLFPLVEAFAATEQIEPPYKRYDLYGSPPAYTGIRNSVDPQALCTAYASWAVSNEPQTFASVATHTQRDWSSINCRANLRSGGVYTLTSAVLHISCSGVNYASQYNTPYAQRTLCTVQACTPPQVRNQSNGQCEDPPPSCEDKTGQIVSTGLYLQGNTATTPFANTACHANCSVKFQGDVPGASQLVAGKTTYYAKGHWEYSGFECSAGEGGVPGATANLPPPTCGTGQVMGQINGNTVCINNGNGKVDNPNSPEKTEEKTKTPPVQNPDGSTTETETTTKADGSTTVITTTTNPDGSSTTTTTTTPGAGSSSSSGGGNGSGNGNGSGSEGNEQVDICKTNPNIPACKETDSGEAASIDGLYEVDPERKTFGTILEGFADKVQQLGWYQSVSGFFNVQVPSGSCGGMSGSVGFGGYSFDYDLDAIFCGSAAQTMYSILSIGVQLAATWIAFSIAFL